MLDDPAGADARDDVVFFVLAVVGNDRADRAAVHFRRGIAEHPLRRGVPRRDDAVEILADDGVVRGLNNRGQQRLVRSRRYGHYERNFTRSDAVELMSAPALPSRSARRLRNNGSPSPRSPGSSGAPPTAARA